MALPRKIMKWLKLYLLVLAITIAIILLGTAIYARWTNKPFFSALRSTFMVSALVLISIGAVSLIPLSEYSYIRGGGRNPVIIREGMEDIKRGGSSNRMGIILGLVGLTLLVVYLIVSA